jgi:hypothetical protein
MIQSWGHSREEDSQGMTVYRPSGYKFPLSRGRAGLEFRPDGTVVQAGSGPDDRSRTLTGSWKALPGNALQVQLPGMATPRRLTILDCDGRVLRVRWDD